MSTRLTQKPYRTVAKAGKVRYKEENPPRSYCSKGERNNNTLGHKMLSVKDSIESSKFHQSLCEETLYHLSERHYHCKQAENHAKEVRDHLAKAKYHDQEIEALQVSHENK